MSAIAADALVRDRLYIGGEWVEPAGTGTIEVVNPTSEEVIGRIPEGNAEDADRAVRAARDAFDSWSRVSPYERAQYCGAIGAKLAERGDELAVLITTELGMPLTLSRMIQAGLPSVTFSSQTDLVEEIEWEEEVGNSLIVREPAGVVAAITPWNYPLSQIANKVAPALTAGCTRGAQAERGGAAQCVRARRDLRRDRLARGCLQPRHRLRPGGGGGDRRPPPRRTWSRSPAPRARGGASRSSPRRPSSPSRWSSAASRPTSSSTTPTSSRP